MFFNFRFSRDDHLSYNSVADPATGVGEDARVTGLHRGSDGDQEGPQEDALLARRRDGSAFEKVRCSGAQRLRQTR
jgi:hypothetical protein